MTPKEKAEKILINHYNSLLGSILVSPELRMYAKKAAIIHVNEVIDQWDYIDTYLADLGGKLNPNLRYWIKVKKELNAL